MKYDTIKKILKALNDAKVRYAVAGGVAVVSYGYARFTKDLDLIIDLERENLLKGLNALASVGYKTKIPVTFEAFANEENRKRWKEEKGMLVLPLYSDQDWETTVDVFSSPVINFDSPNVTERMEAAPGLFAPILGLHELIRLKKEAGRPQDLIDIQKLEFFLHERNRTKNSPNG